MTLLLLKNLRPETTYGIQLRSVAEDVVSEWSPLFSLQTTEDFDAPDVPDWAPSNEWVSNGDTFVATWLPINTSLDQNKDFAFYEIEVGDGSTTKIVRTTNTTYTLTFAQNIINFGSAKATVTARVRSVDNVGNASDYNTLKSVANPAPPAPTALNVTVGTNSLAVSWTPSTATDLLYHRVYVGTTAGFTPNSGNRIFEGAANRTVYTIATTTPQFFKVRAVDKFNQESTDLADATGYTPDSPFVIDSTAPPVPSFTTGSCSITNNANGVGSRATLVWTITSPPSDLAGFYVRYQRTSDSSLWTTVTFNKGDLTGQIELQQAYTDYRFQIKSFDWSNNESAWSSSMTLTSPANAVPQDVTGLTSTPGRDAITYKWNPVSDTDIKNYEVTFSLDATFGNGDDLTFLTGTATTLTVSGLTPASTYRARVRAVDNAGQPSANWSSTNTAVTTSFPLSDGTPPSSSPTPTVSAGIGYLFASWAAVTNADTVTYEVHISTTTGFTPSGGTKVAETNSTTIVLENTAGGTPLAYGTTYFVKLIAKDRDGAAAAGSQGSGSPAKAQVGDLVQLNISDILNGVSDTQLQTGLDGKNKITYSSSAPTSSNANIVGDLWFVRNAGTGITTGVYEGTGGTGPSSYTWAVKTLDNAVVANLDAGKINAGFIAAARIQANTITTDKLVVADITNLAPNYGFEDATYRGIYTLNSGVGLTYETDSTSRGGVGTSIQVASASSGLSFISDFVPVSDGDEIYMSWWQRRGSADFTASPALRVYKLDKSTIVTGGTTLRPVTPSVSATNNTWIQYEGIVTIPSGVEASYARIHVRNDGSGTTGSWRIDDVVVRRAARGLMVVDGTLSARALKTSTLESATITLGTGGIFRTAAGEVIITENGITVTSAATGGISASALTTGTLDAGDITINTGGAIKSFNYSAGSLGYRLDDSGLEINGGSIKADAIKAGTLGGVGGAGIINIAAGTSLVMNGGKFYSNNYGFTSYNASASAGFFLDDVGHVHIPQGQISASTLNIGGTITSGNIILGGTGTAGTIQTAGYSGSSGFRLSTNGLEIPDGSLSALKVVVGSQTNLLVNGYADFEYYQEWFASNILDNANALYSVETSAPYNNTQYIRHTRVGTAGTSDIYLSPTTTSYIHPVQENVAYNYSVYIKGHPTTTFDVVIGIRWSNAAFSNTTVTVPSGSGWTRYSTGSKTAPAGVTGCTILMRLNNTTNGLYYDFDAAQLEEWDARSPRPWKPTGVTTIDGYSIRTGSLRSSNELSINGVSLPYWNIDTQGAAQFGNLLVRGASIVGSADLEAESSFIQSFNYQAGIQGWIIRSDGFAELRQLAADSISGDVIKVGTLYADAIGPGSLNDVIKLEGGMEAKGLAGETVGLTGEDGFYVIGSPEASISSYSINGSSVVTINTSSAHALSVNDWVRFSDILNTQIVNGTYYQVASVVDSDTFTFSLPGSTTVSNTSITGTVYGGASEGKNTPTLVSFPTDGSRPNILSGTLEASTLIVSKGGSFKGAMNFEPSSEIVIASGITNPSVAPTLNATLDKKTWNLRYGRSSLVLNGVTVGHDNNFYGVGASAESVGTSDVRIRKFTRNVSNTGTDVGSMALAKRIDSQLHGIRYSGGSYWVLTSATAPGTATRNINLTKFSTSFVSGGSTLVANVANNDFDGCTLGIDTGATDTILVAIMQPVSFSGVRIRPYVTTTGTPVLGTTSTIAASLAGKKNPVFISRGTFDYGSTRYVVKFSSDKTYYTTNSSGIETPNDHWATYSPTTSAGLWDTVDSRFIEINDVTGAFIYNSGASNWAGTETTKKWWVGYSWYDGTNQTTVSNLAGIELKKRRFLQVTIPDIPKGGSNTPDRARVWMQQISSQPSTPYTGGSWDVRGTIFYPQKTIYADFITTPPADTPSASNTFTTDGVEAIIRTSDNNSFWKGDNTAQFYKLVLQSDQNATGNADNKPGLRVGDPTARHLRIGDNGLYMVGSNTSGDRAVMNFWGETFDFDMGTDGRIMFETAGNIVGRIRGVSSGNDTALILKNNRIVAGVETYNGVSSTVSNTVDFEAKVVYAYEKFVDDSQVVNGSGDARWNSAGTLIWASSSERYKSDIQPMDITVAKKFLGVDSYTFYIDDEVDELGEDAVRRPGFIAERFHEAGLNDWVYYNKAGQPNGLMYSEISAAHNMLIKELYTRIETLESQVASGSVLT